MMIFGCADMTFRSAGTDHLNDETDDSASGIRRVLHPAINSLYQRHQPV